MKHINTLLIDDETGALNTLNGMLGEYCPQIRVVGTARSVDEAVRAAARWKPDLVFLDIRMPPFGTGFDFLQQAWTQGAFGVIFTTAYPEYAIQAIKAVQPWAYLVKPYSVSDLVDAVQVAIEKMQDSETQSIVINDSRKGNLVLRIRDILYCEADGPTTDIFLLRNGKIEKVIASRVLKDIEAELPESQFCRCHHSYLVNMQHVERYEHTGRNGLIYLPQGACVSISVLKMEHFEERFGAFLGG
jgi:two-component system LytT family response regulator